MHVGLAAWSNRHFDHILYPLGTLHREWLPRYSTVFDIVEADVLHHQEPEAGTLEDWITQTPDGFRFLPKLHKAATHGGYDDAALQAAGDAMAWMEPLRHAGRLGPTLAQFPRSFQHSEANVAWLTRLLAMAPPEGLAIEFRHPSWFVPDVEALLRAHGVALCWSTYDGALAPAWETAPFRYIRFVGTVVKRKGRWVTQRDRLDDVLEMRGRVDDETPTYVVVTNRFEGNAVDSLPRIAAALGAPGLAKRCSRRPAEPLFPTPAAPSV